MFPLNGLIEQCVHSIWLIDLIIEQRVHGNWLIWLFDSLISYVTENGIKAVWYTAHFNVLVQSSISSDY